MKKFYATPTVEFTGFDVEDVITVSIQTLADPENVDAILDQVRTTGITANYDDTVHYSSSSYTW